MTPVVTEVMWLSLTFHTSTFTHSKQLFCNRIFTDKAELALNSDSDGLYLRRF